MQPLGHLSEWRRGEPPQQLTQPFLLVSFPRQGTDWFMECMQLGDAYYREFFNPLCTPPRHMDAIAAVFGSERRDGVPATELFWRNIGRPISPHEWQQLRSRTWDMGKWMATKELFSPTKLAVIGASFPTVAVLVRARSHTFPSSRPDYLRDMFASLQLHDTHVGVLDTWKLQWPLAGLDDVARQCAAHLACSYANLRYAMQRGVPPLVFSHLVELRPGSVEAYLHCRLPAQFDAAAVARRLVDTRKPPSFLREREAAYAALGVEPVCAAMAASLVALDGTLDAASAALLLSP